MSVKELFSYFRFQIFFRAPWDSGNQNWIEQKYSQVLTITYTSFFCEGIFTTPLVYNFQPYNF